MYSNLRSLLSIVLIIFSISLYGQSSDLDIDHIGYAEGLSGQLVRCIKEDNNGHLWIATFNELNKYDGYQTKIYDTKNSNIQDGTFIDLLKDAEGRIWALQFDSIYIENTRFRNSEYQTHSYQISIIEPNNNKIAPLDEYFEQIDFSVKDLIWVFQRKQVIYLIDKNGTVLSFDGVFKERFKFDIKDQFVGITNNESYCIINDKNVIQEFDFDHNLIVSYEEILLADKDNVSIGDNGNILFLDRSKKHLNGLQILKDGKSIDLPDYKKNPSNLFNIDGGANWNLQSKLIKGKNKATLIGSQVHFNDEIDDIYVKADLDFHGVTDIEISNAGTYYIANDIGVTAIQKKLDHFKIFQKGNSRSNSVRGMIKYDDIVIAKNENNFIYAESPDGTYDVDFLNNKIQFAKGYHRDVNDKNLIWICGYVDNNLHLIDLGNEEIIVPQEFPWNELNNFFYSTITNTLYSYGSDGLYKNLNSPISWSSVDLKSDQTTIKGINHVVQLNKKIYLATDEGLVIYDEINKVVELIPIEIEDNLCKISFIHQDISNNDKLWLGTRQNGLVVYKSDKTYSIINTEQGLSNNAVHAILEDDLNRLWISTNKYLNCLYKKDNSIYVFTTQDGISHEEFNKYSYYKDPKTGEFYFGGLDGFTYFHPEQITLNDNKFLEVNITEGKSIKRDGSSKSIEIENIIKNTLRIYEDDVVVNLTFALNDLFKAKERKLFYRIREINENWTKIDGNNLSVTKLPYGDYTLEIIADKNSAKTRSKIKVIKLQFIRPFHKTSIFVLGCILLGLLLSYLWYQDRTKRILRKNKHLEALVSERTNELQVANETKNKILAILSHDLKSPMGGLRDYYEKLDYLLKKDRLEEIKEISKISRARIQNLEIALENILNWALAESNTLKSKPEQLSLNFEVDAVIKLFAHIAERKNLQIENRLDVMDQVKVDKNILQTILRNIIQNALKFSYPQGKVVIDKYAENEDSISIAIRDYGVGFDKSKHKQETLSMLGADEGLGFGLSTSKDLAMIGDIGLDIDSDNIEGAKVVITFPKQAFTETIQ